MPELIPLATRRERLRYRTAQPGIDPPRPKPPIRLRDGGDAHSSNRSTTTASGGWGYLVCEYFDPKLRLWRVVGVAKSSRGKRYDVDIGSAAEIEREWRPVERTDRVRVLRFSSRGAHSIPSTDSLMDEEFNRAKPMGEAKDFPPPP